MALDATRAVLVASSAVTTLVGQRISPVFAQQNADVPFVTLSVLSIEPANHLRGANLDTCRVTVSAWARTYAEAEAIGDACRAALVAAGYVCEQRTGDQFNLDPTPGLFGVEHQFLFWQ